MLVNPIWTPSIPKISKKGCIILEKRGTNTNESIANTTQYTANARVLFCPANWKGIVAILAKKPATEATAVTAPLSTAKIPLIVRATN